VSKGDKRALGGWRGGGEDEGVGVLRD